MSSITHILKTQAMKPRVALILEFCFAMLEGFVYYTRFSVEALFLGGFVMDVLENHSEDVVWDSVQ